MAQIKYMFTYLYFSSKYIIQLNSVIIIIILLEYFPLYCFTIKAALQLHHYFLNDLNDVKTLSIIQFYSKISLSSVISKLVPCNPTSDPFDNECPLSFLYLLLIMALLLIQILPIAILSRNILQLTSSKKEDESQLLIQIGSILLRIYFNFYDYVFLRVGNVYLMLIMSNYLLNFVHQIVVLFIAYIAYGFYMCVLISYFNSVYILDNVGFGYPFDAFTRQYDWLLFGIKFLYSIEANLEWKLSRPGPQRSSLAFFCCLTAIVAYIGYICFKLFKLFVFKDYVFYTTNDVTNSFRLFMVIYTFISICFFTFFNSNDEVSLQIIANVSLFIISLILIKLLLWYQDTKIFKGSEINQLIYLINHFPVVEKPIEKSNLASISKRNKNHQDIIMNDRLVEYYNNILVTHFKKCNNSDNRCSLCSILDNSYQPVQWRELLLKVFNGLLQHIEPSLIHSERKDEYFRIRFISLLSNYGNNYYGFNYVISRVINEESKANKVFSANVFVYYKLKIEQIKPLTSKVNMLYSLEDQSKKIKQIIKEMEDLLFVKTLNPLNLVTSSMKMNALRKSLIMRIHKKDSKNQYQSLLCKFILEKLFNARLKSEDNVFDITNYDDILLDSYSNDKHMALSYDLMSKDLNILSSGRDFFKYKGKKFCELFLPDFAGTCLKKFMDSLSLNDQNNTRGKTGSLSRNIFHFPIRDIDYPKYIMSFKMQYMVFPTIDLKISVIFGFYEIRAENLLMTINKPSTNQNIIINYSYSMVKELIAPVEVLEFLAFNKYGIDINTLFLDNQKGSNNYETNSNTYSRLVLKYLNEIASFQTFKDLKDNNYEGFDQIVTNLIEKLKQSQFNNQKMKLKNKKEINGDIITRKYMLYSFDNDMDLTTLLNNENQENNDNLDLLAFIQCNTVGFNIDSGGCSVLGQSSSVAEHSVESGMRYIGTNNKINVNQLIQEQIEKRKQSRNFRVFTRVILSFNVCLILISIILLIMLVNENKRLTSIFNLFILFGKVITLFFNSTLNILFNVCVGFVNETECYNSFTDYENEFVVDHNLPHGFSIKKYFFNELTIKADIIRDYFNELNPMIYEHNNIKLLSVLQSNFIFRYISMVSNKVEVKEEVYAFMMALNVYLNMVSVVIENDDYMTKPIYILNISGGSLEDIELDSINLDAPLTGGQIAGYNIILNFPIYISRMVSMNNLIFVLCQEEIQKYKTIFYIFIVLLFGIHVILMIVCLWFSKFFHKILNNYVQKIETLMESPAQKGILSIKLNSLKTLALLYEDNPNKIIKSILDMEAATKQDKILNAKKENSEAHVQVVQYQKKKPHDTYGNTHYIKILKPSKYSLYSVFTVYFFYSIIFVVLLLFSLNDYLTLILLLSNDITMDTTLFALTGFLQVMLLTNLTEVKILSYFDSSNGNNYSSGFIQTLLMQGFSALFAIERIDNSNINKILTVDNCTELFQTINDTVLVTTDSLHLQYNYSYIIPQICDSYYFMHTNNSFSIVHEISYRLSQIFYKISYTYESLYEINNSYNLFDAYIIIVIIFRPLRNYETIALAIDSFKRLVNTNDWISYLYLCCNILFEVILFITIQIYIINKYSLINKSMNRVVQCIQM